MRSRSLIALTLLFSIIASAASCGNEAPDNSKDTVTPPPMKNRRRPYSQAPAYRPTLS